MLKIIYLKVSFVFLLCICAVSVYAQQSVNDNKQVSLKALNEVESSIVLLKNDSAIIPFKHLNSTNIAVINNSTSQDYLGKSLDNYADITHFNFKKYIASQQKEKINTFNIAIFTLYTLDDINNLLQLKTYKNIVVLAFTKEILETFLSTTKGYKALLYVPSPNKLSQEYAAQLLFGGIAATGKLQSTFSSNYLKGFGLTTVKIRLKYTIPEEVGMDAQYIDTKVDSIMTYAIKNHAFPGAQLLVVKNAKIIFHKTYGFHTYDSVQKVKPNDIYDLASVTKITGALPALMKLYEQGKLNLDKPFSNYWQSWKSKNNKNKLTLREILAHQAGLIPYIIFLKKVIRNKKFKRRFIRNKQSEKFPLKAYDGIFVSRKFPAKIYRIIKRSKVSKEKVYKYSGLSFLIYPKLIAQLTGIPYRTYLQEQFYKPLGAYTMGFTPMTKHFKNSIVPTEQDTIFRKTLVKGWVHDENAALLGGVSGNAGLFATANDLAKLMQLYLQKGTYGGKRYLKEATLNEFTKVQYPKNKNRRGLGFDKPLLNNSKLSLNDAYPAPEVSPESFGHAGFTGTFVWADPEKKLVFIFLSNRVNPTRKNRNLYKLHIRESLQQIFYQAKK